MIVLDELLLSSATVFAFMRRLVTKMEEEVPEVKLILYWTDTER